jgi:NAD(P)-dependent dehydrogenase (short-subunit alcohol dehydrogenase family)
MASGGRVAGWPEESDGCEVLVKIVPVTRTAKLAFFREERTTMAEGGDQGRKTALVTGASGGIGCEIARVLAARGFDLVVTARGGDRLRQLAFELADKHGGKVRVLVKDLAVAGAAREVWQELGESGAQVDVLVNNAGFGTYGPFAETDLVAELQAMQLNMVTLTELTKHFLHGMLARRWGRILNVASTAAFQPGPLMACRPEDRHPRTGEQAARPERAPQSAPPGDRNRSPPAGADRRRLAGAKKLAGCRPHSDLARGLSPAT